MGNVSSLGNLNWEIIMSVTLSVMVVVLVFYCVLKCRKEWFAYREKVPHPEWLYEYRFFRRVEYVEPYRVEYILSTETVHGIRTWFLKQDLKYLICRKAHKEYSYFDREGKLIPCNEEFQERLAKYEENITLRWNRTQGHPERLPSLPPPYARRELRIIDPSLMGH